MRFSMCGMNLLAVVVLAGGTTAFGQASTSAENVTSSLEVSLTFTPVLANQNRGSGFAMQGGGVQMNGQFWRGLGAAADITGLHSSNMNGSGVGLDLVTATFGPRYTWSHNRFAAFGQALVGEANGMNSIFPAAQGANFNSNSMALQLGGGINRALSQRFSVRVVELDWLRTQLPNGSTNVQNNLKLGVGLVFRTKAKPE